MRPVLVLLLLAVAATFVAGPPHGAVSHGAVEVQVEVMEPEASVAEPPAAGVETERPAVPAGVERASALRQTPEDPPPEA